MKALLVPVYLAICVACCFGQSSKTVEPDFSGTWEFDAGRSNVGKSTKRSPEQIKITHHDPELIIRRKVRINGVSEERDLTYYTDGRGERNPATFWVTTNPNSDSFRPSETTSKTTWRKDRIVTRSFSRSYVAGTAIVEFEVIDELRLSSDGKTLTRSTRTVPKRDLSPNPPVVVGSGAEFKTVYKLISK